MASELQQGSARGRGKQRAGGSGVGPAAAETLNSSSEGWASFYAGGEGAILGGAGEAG